MIKKDEMLTCIDTAGFNLTVGKLYRAQSDQTDELTPTVRVLNDKGNSLYYGVSLFKKIKPQIPDEMLAFYNRMTTELQGEFQAQFPEYFPPSNRPTNLDEARQQSGLPISMQHVNVPAGTSRRLTAFIDLLHIEAALNQGRPAPFTFGIRDADSDPVSLHIMQRDTDPTYRLPIFLADPKEAEYLTRQFASTIKALFS